MVRNKERYQHGRQRPETFQADRRAQSEAPITPPSPYIQQLRQVADGQPTSAPAEAIASHFRLDVDPGSTQSTEDTPLSEKLHHMYDGVVLRTSATPEQIARRLQRNNGKNGNGHS